MTSRAGPPDLKHPRVRRTHDHVIDVARELLIEGGARALTYTALGERAGVTRQTLYRHWPRLDLLIGDVVTTGPVELDLRPGTDAAVVVREFLTALRDRFQDPSTFAALIAVIGASGADRSAADALVRVTAARRRLLNSLLAPTGLEVDDAAFARLVGPVLFQILHSADGVDDEFIATTASSWLRASD